MTATVGAGIKATTGFYYATYLERGIIVVTPSCRGRDSDLELNGFAPSGIADLKAAVRYLKYNDAILPGDSERIISVGGMSALLGSTGNSPDYADALNAIAAAEATDDIYAAICYCPITDLDYADGGYEWIHYAEKSGYSDFELALQDAFYYGFIDYVQDFDLDRTSGDDGRSGDYYTDFLAACLRRHGRRPEFFLRLAPGESAGKLPGCGCDLPDHMGKAPRNRRIFHVRPDGLDRPCDRT